MVGDKGKVDGCKNGTFCKLLIMRSIIGDARY